MSTAAKRAPTFEELYLEIERLPQSITGQILIPGVLTTMSRPGAAHDHALAHCEHALHPFDRRFDGHGWWFRQEFEVRFPGDRLCAEVLSPSTASDDRTLKLPLFASTGVAHVWLIDPALRTIEVYESIDGRPTLVATARDANIVRLPPFDAELALATWWKAPAATAVASP